MTFAQYEYDHDYNPNFGKLNTRYIHHRADVVIPNNVGPWNLVHGVVRVSEELTNLSRIYAYLEFVHKDFDMIVDNFSIKRIPGICGTNLLVCNEIVSIFNFSITCLSSPI